MHLSSWKKRFHWKFRISLIIFWKVQIFSHLWPYVNTSICNVLWPILHSCHLFLMQVLSMMMTTTPPDFQGLISSRPWLKWKSFNENWVSNFFSESGFCWISQLQFPTSNCTMGYLLLFERNIFHFHLTNFSQNYCFFLPNISRYGGVAYWYYGHGDRALSDFCDIRSVAEIPRLGFIHVFTANIHHMAALPPSPPSHDEDGGAPEDTIIWSFYTSF